MANVQATANDPVVFAAGDYRIDGTTCSVTLHVPSDVRLSRLQMPLTNLVRAWKGVEGDGNKVA